MTTMGNGMGMGGGIPQPRMTPPRNMMPPRTQYLPGRFIVSEDEISPGEVPMDNSISFFCYNDLSKIVIKQWNNRGVLDTATYTMDVPAQTQIASAQQQNQMPDVPAPPPPMQQVTQEQTQPNQPDAMQELQASIQTLGQTIEAAFNNFGANIQQGFQTINSRLENLDHGQG